MSDVDLAIAAEQFDRAVELLRDARSKRPLTPSELVRLARCIQLSGRGDLAEAEQALQEALAAVPDYPVAKIDLAWFRYAVANQTSIARELFSELLGELRASANECLAGLVQCVAEMEGEEKARALLQELSTGFLDRDAIAQRIETE